MYNCMKMMYVLTCMIIEKDDKHCNEFRAYLGIISQDKGGLL
jgi:hypothetical protein